MKEYNWVFFFFQAEDGIRDKLVTGVQTCALPIWVLGGIEGGKPPGALQSDDSALSHFPQIGRLEDAEFAPVGFRVFTGPREIPRARRVHPGEAELDILLVLMDRPIMQQDAARR